MIPKRRPIPATSAASSANDSDFFDSRGLKRKTRALTDDGYPIYTPKELKIGMGGGQICVHLNAIVVLNNKEQP